MTDEPAHQYYRIWCTTCGLSFDIPSYCGDRFCPTCNVFRRARIKRKLSFILQSLHLEQGIQVRFLTLTIPNQSNLDKGARVLINSFRRFRQRQWWRNRVRGGCFVLEVTGRPGCWHIHLHAIIESRYLPIRIVSRIWAECSPGRIVHIKLIPVAAVVRYLTKYITKTELSIADRRIASFQLKNVRLFQPFGSWHAASLKAPHYGHACPRCGDLYFLTESQLRKQFEMLAPAVGPMYQPTHPP